MNDDSQTYYSPEVEACNSDVKLRIPTTGAVEDHLVLAAGVNYITHHSYFARHKKPQTFHE